MIPSPSMVGRSVAALLAVVMAASVAAQSDPALELWSLRPLPRTVPVPAAGEGWTRGPLDRFVASRWPDAPPGADRAAKEAGRATWLRRVSFDLTGLPPAPAAIARFVGDRRHDAFEREVDRLLATTAYGERMASYWLDVARYADTLGYQADRHVPMWPWRDWVIRAFEQNLPWDRFLTWQIAGDLLPDATTEQRLATGFQRLHRQTEEGGTVEEEFRVEYVADRVDTFGTAVLGMTVACARCHDHKFDPITQRDYYSLFAFFQNIDESGQTSHFTDAVPVPSMLLPSPADERRLVACRQRVAEAEAALAGVDGEAARRARRWAGHLARAEGSAPGSGVAEREVLTTARAALRGAEVASYAFDAIGTRRALADRRAGRPPAHAAAEIEWVSDGALGGALRLDGDSGVTAKKVGAFTRSDAFSIGLFVQAAKRYRRAVILHKSRAALDAGSRGYELIVEDGRLVGRLAHMWPGNAIAVVTEQALPVGRFVHVAMTYDGSSRASGISLYVDGVRQKVRTLRDALTRRITYRRVGEPPLVVGQRFRDTGWAGGLVDELVVYNRELVPIEIAEWVTGQAFVEALRAVRAGARRLDLERWRREVIDCERIAAAKELARARRLERDAVLSVPSAMVMRETATPKRAFVLTRGAYDQRGARVGPATPAALPAFGDRPRNRLGLAEWLCDPDHPLTARVAVNRFWAMLFGRGLSNSPGDFGTQGSPPSHPLLLDWLARRFVESGWNVKALLREIVLSSTYRQASVGAASRGADPDNVWLSRGPRHRLPAEMIRDAALSVGGLLVERPFGAPVYPPQPPGLWHEVSGKRFVASRGSGRYRRSLYTFFKRTAPPPSMILFDLPRRSECVVRRQETDTALQALVLQNDVQFVEAAAALALRVHGERDGVEPRLLEVFGRVLQRKPDPRELEIVRGLFAAERERFDGDPKAARSLLAFAQPPRKPLPRELAGAGALRDVAALTIVASTLMNHEEFVTKR